MLIVLLSVIVFHTGPVLGQATDTPGEIPSISEAAELASLVITEKNAYQSLRIDVEIDNGSASLHGILLHSKPNQWAAFLIDNMDNTPVFASAEGQAFLYNPYQSGLALYDEAGVAFSFSFAEDSVFFLTGVEPARDEGVISHKVNIDTRQLFLRPDLADVHVSPTGEGAVSLSVRTANGGTAIATVDPSARIPLQSLEVRSKEGKGEGISLSVTEPTAPIDDTHFSIHASELRNLPQIQQDSKGLQDQYQHMQAMIQATLLRRAIYDESVRDKISLPEELTRDWQKLENMDKEMSAALRSIFATNADLFRGPRRWGNGSSPKVAGFSVQPRDSVSLWFLKTHPARFCRALN